MCVDDVVVMVCFLSEMQHCRLVLLQLCAFLCSLRKKKFFLLLRCKSEDELRLTACYRFSYCRMRLYKNEDIGTTTANSQKQQQ